GLVGDDRVAGDRPRAGELVDDRVVEEPERILRAHRDVALAEGVVLEVGLGRGRDREAAEGGDGKQRETAGQEGASNWCVATRSGPCGGGSLRTPRGRTRYGFVSGE